MRQAASGAGVFWGPDQRDRTGAKHSLGGQTTF